MTAFWIAAGLLLALALATLCWPLLRQHRSSHTSRKALNAAIFRDQMKELDRDLANGSLSAADHASARDELERRILEDLADDSGAAPAPSRRLPRTALALAASLPVAAVALYLFAFGNPASLDPAAQQAGAPAPSAAEVEKMVAELAAKLEKNPANPQGWVMLGRSYKVMGRFEEAARAFEKAGPLMESEPELMLEMAELSANMNEGRIEGKGLALLQQLLKEQPKNPQALVLAGTDAYFRKHYADAARYWEQVLAQLPPDSEDARNLTAGVAKAREMAGQPAAKAAPRAAGAGSAVSGRVSLAPALQGKVAPDDMVYIFARATSGPRMPLAVLRARVSELPKDFSLDDSMAMSPELKLSSVSELRIEARVSKSGDATPKAGDLSGEISPVKPGARHLQLTIDKILP